MASQQQPRPLFRFASMVRPAQVAQPPAPAPTPAPAPQPLFRTTTAAPFRPQVPPAQDPTPQTPATATAPVVAPPQTPAAAPVVNVVPAPAPAPAPTPATPQQPPRAAVSTIRSPILSPQPQPVAAGSPRPTTTAPPPKSPTAVVSPPKVPPPRSPLGTITAPKSPSTKVTTPVFKGTTDVTRVQGAPITPYSSLPSSPKTKMADSTQILNNQSSPPKAPTPSRNVIQPPVKTQTYSPQVKPAVSHPPSPLKLPPPQLDLESKIPPQVDQKTVVVQETTRANYNSQATRNGKNMENGKREVKKEKGAQQKKGDTAEDLGVSVLTLAGENKGAIMELSPSRNKYSPQSLQKQGSPKAWSSEDDGEKSGSESGKANRRGNKPNQSLPMTAFMNSNVQGVNNSILHNASCTHHDPGVHLVFSRKANGFHVKGSPKS